MRLCIFNVYDLPVPALTRANHLRLASTAGGCLHNGQGIAKLHALAVMPQAAPLPTLFRSALEHLTLEMLAYGRQKPAFSHFVARIFKKILAEQLAHFIR